MYYNGSVVHTAVLPLGGYLVTNDIAVGTRTPKSEAERIKLRHGCAMISMVGDKENIEVPSVGGREPQFVQPPSQSSVRVATMEHSRHLHHTSVIVDAIEDAPDPHANTVKLAHVRQLE